MSEDPADWDICDDHEQSFPRGGYCKDCRIDELEKDKRKAAIWAGEWRIKIEKLESDLTGCIKLISTQETRINELEKKRKCLIG